MEDIKQNKNSSVIFFLSFFFLCLFCTPVFADSLNGIDFSTQPIPTGTSSLPNQYSYQLSSNPDWYAQAYVGQSSFCFASSDQLYLVSTGSNIKLRGPGFGGGSSLTEYDDSSGLYFKAFGSLTSSSILYVPLYSSVNEGLSAIKYYIDTGDPSGGGSSTSEVHPLNISLPAGNMIIVDISGMDISRDRYFAAFAHFEYGEPSGTAQNQQWGYWESIPDNPSLPFVGWESVNWQGVGKRTPLGLYLDFTFQTYIDSNLGHYVYFVNPYRPADSETNDQNPNVDLFFPQASGYRIFELEVLWNSGSGVFGGGADGNTGSGVYDPDTGTWTTINDQTGDPWEPVVGGGNAVSPQTTINAWLQNIANQIKSFFQGSIGAVTTLVGAGSEFFAVVQNLYSWLPSPVLGVLSSALILVITIGVIKVFI